MPHKSEGFRPIARYGGTYRRHACHDSSRHAAQQAGQSPLRGFAGAFRQSELVALELADLAFKPNGLWRC